MPSVIAAAFRVRALTVAPAFIEKQCQSLNESISHLFGQQQVTARSALTLNGWKAFDRTASGGKLARHPGREPREPGSRSGFCGVLNKRYGSVTRSRLALFARPG